MITLTLFQVSTLITAFVSLFLGLFVYFSGEKTKLSFSWLLTSIAVSVWSAGLFGVVFSTTEIIAWFWQYILDIGGICVPILYFNFLLHLIKKEKKLIVLQIFSLIAGTLLIILNFTDLFKTGISPKFGINFWIDSGKLYPLFPLYFATIVIISTCLIIKEYRLATDKDNKRQLMYVLTAQIFGFGGAFTDFFPQVFNVYPFGNYFVILYVIFISYAALKHHLFNMRVIATELLTFSIWAFLLVKTLLSNTYGDFVLNGVILTAVVIAGILLIRSVIREVEQREKIEKIEKEIERAYEVEKRGHELEKKANEELKLLDKSKNQFLMQAQHDLRTPLTLIRGYCDLLIGGTFGKQSKETAEVLEKIEVVTENKIKDINNFLDVSQFQLGKKIISLKPGVELNPILQEISEVLSSTAKEKGIYLKLEKPKGMIAIEADREKLKAAIFNIVDNSIKYTPKGGVTIKTEINGSVKISIVDTGIGISKERIKTLFDTAFERGEDAKKTFAAGMGIGLYLSSQIVKAHNGKIWVESDGKEKGSTFFVELPIKK
jgi:signal transduction histidine kinase